MYVSARSGNESNHLPRRSVGERSRPTEKRCRVLVFGTVGPARPCNVSFVDGSEAALAVAAEQARLYLASLDTRPVPPNAGFAEVRERFGYPLAREGMTAERVVAELAGGVADALMAMSGGRFFGFVVGGTLPAALAADWLVSAWDQNTGLAGPSPGTAAVEDVAAGWLVDVLGLPLETSVGFVTGGQMANFTCLAAARHHALAAVGWDVEVGGLNGAPAVRVVTGEQRHATIDVALRYLGLGRAETVASDSQGRLRPDALERVLAGSEGPLIVCAQAGNINTGAVDPLDQLVEIVHGHGGWMHVDGAFGLWAAASARRRGLLAGYKQADSWATDAHKWLNTPYDCGLAFTAHAASHRAAMSVDAAYLVQGVGRDGLDWAPEFSRRARGVPVWAALRSLGSDGAEDLVDRCCDHATRFADTLRTMPGTEVLNDVVLNQVLVRFVDPDGDHDGRTKAVLAAIQADGTCYPTGSTWHGMSVVRISVSNWRTTADDVDRSLEAIRRVLTR